MDTDSGSDQGSQARKSASQETADAPKAPTPWVIPAITAVSLAAAFCAYYFVYVGSRREYLANRNFRALALLGEQFQQRVSVHGNILEFCASLAAKKQATHRQKEDLAHFLLVRREDVGLPLKDKEREALKDYLKYLAPSFDLTEVPREASGTRSSLRVEHRDDHWELTLTAFPHSGTDQDYRGSLKIDDLMEPLVGSLPFDDVLLVSNEGTIVYHSKQTGPQFTTLSGLLQAQIAGAEGKPAGTAPGETESRSASPGGTSRSQAEKPDAPINLNQDPLWRSRSPHLTDVLLAGTRYKLFLQPVLVSSFSDSNTLAEPASEWVLCGLTSSAAMDWEALSLSYTFFIWFSVVFFLIWTSYKVLKILFMNQRERLRLRELGALGLSLVLLTNVLTLSFLQLDFRANDDTNVRLKELGGKLATNIHDELRRMSDQLTSWCSSEVLQRDLRDIAANNKEIIRNAQSEDLPLSGRSIGHPPEPERYPYLSNAFWTDDDGHQIIKWSTTPYVTPMIDVSQLSIYATPATRLDGDPRAFHFASILPPNKLEYLATLGMKTRDCAKNGLDPQIREDIAGGSAFLTAQPLSLIDPILPYGYGFALVDKTGSVVFHSDKTRNGRENFLLESDGSKELYAALFARSSPHSLPVRYMGRDYRVLVVPFEQISEAPWSLIVYRDLTSVRTLNLQVMTVVSTLLLLVLAGPVVLISLWGVVRRPRFAPEWLWPDPRRSAVYIDQLRLYGILILIFLLLTLVGSSEAVLIACLAAPGAVLLLTPWCFRERTAHAGKRWRGAPGDIAQKVNGTRRGSLNYRQGYFANVLLLLLLMGVLIPMALFRTSLNVERRLAVKQAQQHLASALARRWALTIGQNGRNELGEAAWCTFQAGADCKTQASPWPWIVPVDLLPPGDTPPVDPHSEARELYSGWFRRLLYSLHHDYNDASAEMLGLIPDRGNPPDWSWEERESSITLRWRGAHPSMSRSAAGAGSAANGDLLLVSSLPSFSWSGRATYAGIAAAVTLGVGGLFFALARKLFRLDMAPLKMTGTRRVAESLREGRNLLILLPPVSDWTLDAPKRTLDLAEVAKSPKWAEDLDATALPLNTVIEILHFEFSTGDAEIDNQKFVLLERLMRRENTQVVVIMTVPVSSEDYRRTFPDLEVIDLRDQPFAWLKQYEGPAQDLIWKECGPMPALWPLGAQLAKDIKAETVYSEDTVASEMLERADPYYRMIWRECSKEQRFVLSQLAEDGLLNPTNGRTIRQLVRRGLITNDPQFRIMNESFRRFLRSATTLQMKQEWVQESRRSGWGKVHGAFFTTMTLLGVFLLATQNALWQSAAAYVTTALGALGTLTKFSDVVRGRGGTDKAS